VGDNADNWDPHVSEALVSWTGAPDVSAWGGGGNHGVCPIFGDDGEGKERDFGPGRDEFGPRTDAFSPFLFSVSYFHL
jgi:hypothetical protein